MLSVRKPLDHAKAFMDSLRFSGGGRNMSYSLLNYVSQPVLMLVATPLLLRGLGAREYGLWMLVNSILAAIGGLGSGFGDAAIKYVAHYRGRQDSEGVQHSFSTTLLVNLALGCLLATAVTVAAPWLVGRVFRIDAAQVAMATSVLRIAAWMLVTRLAETVFTSSLRAYERYGPPVMVGIATRAVATTIAVMFALHGLHLTAILESSLVTSVIGVSLQAIVSCRITGTSVLRLAPSAGILKEVLQYGSLTWLKSVSGTLFAYVDRFFVAVLLGMAPLAYFSMWVQLAQPVNAIVIALFGFLFPHFAVQLARGSVARTRQVFAGAMVANVAVVCVTCAPLLVAGRQILTLWVGPAIAAQGTTPLVILVLGYGSLALGIVPHYTLMALGRVRYLAIINVVSGVLAIATGLYLIPRFGIIGAAYARLASGLPSLLNYLVADRELRTREAMSSHGPQGEMHVCNGFDIAQQNPVV